MLGIQFNRGQWRSNYYWQIPVLIIAVISILFFISKKLFYSKVTPESIPNKLVEVEPIKSHNLQQTIHLLGTIHPKHATTLIAKESGMLDTLIPTGQKVTKGTLIAKINNPDLEKNLQLSLSAVELAKAQYERITPLIKSGYVSTKEVEEKNKPGLMPKKNYQKQGLN